MMAGRRYIAIFQNINILLCFLLGMEVMLDSSFILSCARRKIDFLAKLEGLGFKIVILREVLQEMKDLKQKVRREDRTAIELALEQISKAKIKKVGFGMGKVDEELIRFGRKGIYIGTLDKYIKRNVPNKVGIENATNDLIVERD